MDTQLTIRLPLELAGNLEKFSKKIGLKRSDIVRFVLQQALGSEKKKKSDSTVYARVHPLLGSIQTGMPDLGEMHRSHVLAKLKKHA